MVQQVERNLEMFLKNSAVVTISILFIVVGTIINFWLREGIPFFGIPSFFWK